MLRFRALVGGRHGAALAAALLAAAGLAGSAPAAEPEARGAAAGLQERRIVCTPFGCRPLPRASWSWVAAFATASIAAGWLGRRMRSARIRG